MQSLRSLRKTVILLWVLAVGLPVSLSATDITPGEIVIKHLDAIGSAQARKDIKSRVVEGGTTYRILVGGTGAIDGKFEFASGEQKSNFLFKINGGAYRGEQFICDGSKTSVAGTYTDKRRSEFGNFVLTQDLVLRENLLGGVWSSAWTLLDVEGRKAKLHSEGTKKIDGKDLLVLRYLPRKNTDLNIFLYFDPQNFRHVMTIYKFEPSTSLVGGETAMAGKSTRRYRLEERFSEFETVDGLTLPTRYDLRYTQENENGFAKSVEWEVKAHNIMNNQSIDTRSFQVK